MSAVPFPPPPLRFLRALSLLVSDFFFGRIAVFVPSVPTLIPSFSPLLSFHFPARSCALGCLSSTDDQSAVHRHPFHPALTLLLSTSLSEFQPCPLSLPLTLFAAVFLPLSLALVVCFVVYFRVVRFRFYSPFFPSDLSVHHCGVCMGLLFFVLYIPAAPLGSIDMRGTPSSAACFVPLQFSVFCL